VMCQRDQPLEREDAKCYDLAAAALCNSKLQIIHFRENGF
jgi:hypothetical protein